MMYILRTKKIHFIITICITRRSSYSCSVLSEPRCNHLKRLSEKFQKKFQKYKM